MEEVAPPWIALPNLAPGEDTTQGIGAAYYDLNFVPFWASLDRDKKAAYLDRWNASPKWREWIAFALDNAEGIDFEAEARESETELAFRKTESEPPKSRWGRLLGGRD